MKIVPRETDYRKILEHKEAELEEELRRPAGIAIETSPDQMDEIQFASERDLAIRNADRESRLLRQVRNALARVREGSFGACIECDVDISTKRLAAVPWASRCIDCQDKADREGTPVDESFAFADVA